MTTIVARTVGMVSVVSPDPAGFGMWRAGVPMYCWADVSDRRGDGQAEIDAFLEASRNNGFEYEVTNELDGLIYDQRGQLVKFWPHGQDPTEENTDYHQFWTREAEDYEILPRERRGLG